MNANLPEPKIDPQNVTFKSWEYTDRLRGLRVREWWMWGLTVAVILLLTLGIVSFSLPAIVADMRAAIGTGFLETIVGLVSLIMLFIGYLTYEKMLINRLRFELAEGQFQSSLWRNMALMDPLTGLYNRRFAEKHLKTEIARARRRGYPLTLALFDLDNFKQINDTLGHPAGDAVLKGFADRLAKVVREGDLAARLGGDEFMLLLADCKSSDVPLVLRRLGSVSIQFGDQQIPVDFSHGWAEYQDGDQSETLFHYADKLLYAHKQARKELATPAVKA